MNKSALLHMVRNVSALSDQDVEELEKLVKNFPYCQTAHLLIAKASYDKGNMLSNQKLRKAAAYATNRQLLKKLIYTTDATVPVTAIESSRDVVQAEPEITQEISLVPEAENALVPNAGQDSSEIIISTDSTNSESVANEEIKSEELPESDNIITLPENTIIAEEEVAPANDAGNATNTNTIEPVEPFETDSLNSSDATSVEDINFIELADTDKIFSQESIILLPSFEPANSLTLSELEEMLQVEKWTTSVISPETVNESAIELDYLTASEEFEKINPVPAAEIIRYELEVPEDQEENTLDQTLANFDSYLFKPEQDVFFNSELKPATNEEFVREVYTSNQLGYWMGSSRLGELLQVKDELTHHTPLQFYPDLILEYSKQNYLTPTDPPKTTLVNRQFEIIDQFLKSNPKLKTFSPDKLRAEPQDDLAFKSTKNTKNLASENLANILVQQGKIKKAIKIYEHLIVKIPEKKAYFAAQIEKLRNQI